jgi:hypothetical protein
VATFALRFGLAALATNVPLAGSFVRIARPLSASSGEPLFGPVLNHWDECVLFGALFALLRCSCDGRLSAASTALWRSYEIVSRPPSKSYSDSKILAAQYASSRTYRKRKPGERCTDRKA